MTNYIKVRSNLFISYLFNILYIFQSFSFAVNADDNLVVKSCSFRNY